MTRDSVQLPEQLLEAETPLWRFSISLWNDHGTAQAALQLQDRGWAVSHLLVAAFLAQEGCVWDGLEPEAIRYWRQSLTQELRAIRKSLPKNRSDLADLRSEIAQAELEAERVELNWWYDWLQKHPLPGTPPQQVAHLLAQNLVVPDPKMASTLVSLLSNFARPLISSGTHESFVLELQDAIAQLELQS